MLNSSRDKTEGTCRAQFDAGRGGEKMLNSARDKTEGTCRAQFDASRRGKKNAEFFSKKARTVVGRGAKSPLCDPGSELRLGREKEKDKVRG